MMNTRSRQSRSRRLARANGGAPAGKAGPSSGVVSGSPDPAGSLIKTEAAPPPVTIGAVHDAVAENSRVMMEQTRAPERSTAMARGNHHGHSPSSSSYSDTRSDPSSRYSHADLELDGPEMLKHSDSYRVRADWMFSFKLVFEAAPRRYKHQIMRVHYALSKLDPFLSEEFENYASTRPAEDGVRPTSSWRVFSLWFDTEVCDPVNLRLEASREYCNARQDPDQSPWAFAAKLETCEQRMAPLPDPFRADFFRYRLLPRLQEKLVRFENHGTLSRDVLVSKAQMLWDMEERNARNSNPDIDLSARASRNRRYARGRRRSRARRLGFA
ncbi:hypothetical protein SEPCBS57363_000378 [Sporothrix epigloea]|uniref:Uncharacterized protein n=1 Tax=Sporothrix epigloea TaxID=1892477 RepID=A0ABP0D4B7_9PEZI